MRARHAGVDPEGATRPQRGLRVQENGQGSSVGRDIEPRARNHAVSRDCKGARRKGIERSHVGASFLLSRS